MSKPVVVYDMDGIVITLEPVSSEYCFGLIINGINQDKYFKSKEAALDHAKKPNKVINCQWCNSPKSNPLGLCSNCGRFPPIPFQPNYIY